MGVRHAKPGGQPLGVEEAPAGGPKALGAAAAPVVEVDLRALGVMTPKVEVGQAGPAEMALSEEEVDEVAIVLRISCWP